MTYPLLVKKLNPDAIIPTKQRNTDAGYDIYCLNDETFLGYKSVDTGIAIATPPGYYARVASRSGLSFNENVEVGAGVIDESYRGEIKVKLYCHQQGKIMTLKKGQRIAQIILTPYLSTNVVEVTELPETCRGSDGFGSSGA